MKIFKLSALILVVILMLAASVMAAWFVASEKVSVTNGSVVSLTAATYGRARSAQLQVETATILWSCDPTGFGSDNTTGFTANPMTPIWLDSADKIRNFRAIAVSTTAVIKACYFE